MAVGHGGFVCFTFLSMSLVPQIWACWDLKSPSPRLQLTVTASGPPHLWVSCWHHAGTECLGWDWCLVA